MNYESLLRYRDKRLTSLDIFKIVQEFKEKLVGTYVANIYGSQGLYFIKLRGSTKRYLRILPEVEVHLTNKIPETSINNFVKILRTKIRNAKIMNIQQRDFDRIMIIEFNNGYELIVELIPRGAFVLVDSNKKIIAAHKIRRMKDRIIAPNADYIFPPNAPKNPLDLTKEEILRKILKYDQILRGLMAIGISKKYALELCTRVQIDCKKRPEAIDEHTLEKLVATMLSFIKEVIASKKGYVYELNKKPIAYAPIRLSIFNFADEIMTESFNEAIEYFYDKATLDIIKSADLEKYLTQKAQLEKIYEKQIEAVRAIETKIEKLRRRAELISENYELIDKILRGIQYAKDNKGLDWSKIEETIKTSNSVFAKIIKRIAQDGTIEIKLNDITIEANYRDRPIDIINSIYAKIKKLKQKLEGAKKAAEETKTKLEKLEMNIADIKQETTWLLMEPEYEWYHGFRWFITSAKHKLVVAGKDAVTNDTLLRKYLSNDDLIFHADIIGAAVTILKEGKTSSERDIQEAAMYAAAYSKAWEMGLASVDVFYTDKEGISLAPPSGQYLRKGSFIVKRKTLIKNIPLELAIGFRLHINEPYIGATILSAPLSAIRELVDFYVCIRPGAISKSEIARDIFKSFQKRIIEKVNLRPRLVNRLIKIERIIELIPGDSELWWCQ